MNTLKHPSFAWSIQVWYSAYSPDLPGCVSAGNTAEETEANMRESIEFHIEGMREEGLSIPIPQSRASYVEVAV